ncbi:suppressor of glycerol defect [Lithohypha guttulata]|uniref:Suppressor of glycerol defect n=1 Tax=Lithohypha guttulata TaxID=1690604 RepID=A0AAN7T1I1_9EURO|nr:suppressor of glycerol defect [Lithohypha guttulata]KAK5097185.1 suppressor of glycerol defect [Lithohypha guttulata]
MSRHAPQNAGRKAPQLPFAMKQKLGLQQNNRRKRTQVAERKQERKEARRTHAGSSHKRIKITHETPEKQINNKLYDKVAPSMSLQEAEGQGFSDYLHDVTSSDLSEEEMQDFGPSKTKKSRDALNRTKSPSPSRSPLFEQDEEEDWDELSRGSREYSPEVVLDANSTTFKQRQSEDDAEILALEKRLGVRAGKNKVFEDDYDDLLQGLEGDIDSALRKHKDKQWLEQKRSMLEAQRAPNRALPGEGENDSSENDDVESQDSDQQSAEATDDFEDFDTSGTEVEDSISLPEVEVPVRKQRENPYIAPVTPGASVSTGKYIPPSLRKLPQSDTEKLAKLRRQAQGSLNKLSEANIISIVDEFDKLYQNNPRQDVTTALIDLLLAAFSIHSALQNTFIILHAAFVAALHKILGADFGAEIVSRLVETFNKHHTDASSQGKESLNLISLIANLFTFGVISSTLVCDHIRLLLSDFGENSAELLLRVIRDCGPQLRTDNPAALKGIIQMMNEIAARMSTEGQTVNVRTRVMMDAIVDLKNNKTRQATNAAGVTGEHLTRMKKALGSLNTRQLRGTEPLGISRNDILNSEKKGKWWLVGASWKGHDQGEDLQPKAAAQSTASDDLDDQDFDPDNIDYISLARHHKLTTPTQRSIFTAILSATDATDALHRISKLRLNRKQELEIPKVLLRLCRAEPAYNPYYAVLSRLLLRDGKRYKFAFQVAVWKFFEEIGERSAEDDDDMGEVETMQSESVQVHEIANTARLCALLVARGSMSLDVLKTLNIGYLKENATLWLEMFFVSLFTQPKMTEEVLTRIFSEVRADTARVVDFFLQQNVRRSDLVGGKDDRAQLKKWVRVAGAALAAMERDGLEDDFE